MELFMSSTHNEFLKLLSKRKYFVFFLIEIAICVIAVLVEVAINKASRGTFQIGYMDLSLAMLTFFITVYIPLVVFMAACDTFSAEIQDGTIRAVLMRPISRFKIYISKVAAVLVMSIIYLVSLFLVTTLLEAFFSQGIRNFWVSIGAYLLDIIPLFVVVLMAAVVNQVTKSSTLAMFMLILIYALLMVAGIFIPQLSGLLFTGYLQWHNIWIGQTIPFGAMLSKIGLLVGYAAVFLSSGYYLFERKEI